MSTCIFKRLLKFSLILLVSLFLFAFEKRHIDTEQGYYLLDVQFITQPVKVGRNTMKLTIYEKKSKKPVEKKLDIEVVPWMPKHEHGTTDAPAVREIEKGQYLIEGIDFSMPGRWEVYVRMTDGRKEDTGVFDVSVEK
jgi:hypothetical protein